jgi:hypothetical protein
MEQMARSGPGRRNGLDTAAEIGKQEGVDHLHLAEGFDICFGQSCIHIR